MPWMSRASPLSFKNRIHLTMTFIADCKCGKKYKLDDDFEGKSVKCKACGVIFKAARSKPVVATNFHTAPIKRTDKAPIPGWVFAAGGFFAGGFLTGVAATLFVVMVMLLSSGDRLTRSNAGDQPAVASGSPREEFRAIVERLKERDAMNALCSAMYNTWEQDRSEKAPPLGWSDQMHPPGKTIPSTKMQFTSDEFIASTNEATLTFLNDEYKGQGVENLFRNIRAVMYYDDGWKVEKIEVRAVWHMGWFAPAVEEFGDWQLAEFGRFKSALEAIIDGN